MTQPAETPKPTTPAPIRFQLTAARRGLIMVYGKLQEHEGRLADLTPQPPSMTTITGSYKDLAAEATRRNNAQMNSGFLDYLYAPEPITESVVTA